jgi:LysM repeat protein
LDLKDYRGWAYGLKAAGYATDPKYPDKLISIIERYELYKLDGSENPAAPVAINPSNQKVHFVRKGDTLYSISKTYGVTVDRLKQLNQLNDDNISIGQDLVIDND